MINIERSRKILKAGGLNLNDEDIKTLRDYLYGLATLQIENENKEGKQ